MVREEKKLRVDSETIMYEINLFLGFRIFQIKYWVVIVNFLIV